MASTFDYIENYFAGNLPDEEKRTFERKCENDPVFAEEVGFYMALRKNLRKELYNQKKKSLTRCTRNFPLPRHFQPGRLNRIPCLNN